MTWAYFHNYQRNCLYIKSESPVAISEGDHVANHNLKSILICINIETYSFFKVFIERTSLEEARQPDLNKKTRRKTIGAEFHRSAWVLAARQPINNHYSVDQRIRMKVDTSRLKKGTSDVPTECQTLIDKLRACTMDELLIELNQIDSWTFGKSELYHWIDILDIFDGILEDATKQIGNDWFLACDERFPPKKRQLLLAILNFTTLLIEHSFSRHLYNSVEHLTQLLSSTNMEIILGVLNLLYMFSKRSNFIPRLNCAKRNALLARLTYIAEVSSIIYRNSI